MSKASRRSAVDLTGFRVFIGKDAVGIVDVSRAAEVEVLPNAEFRKRYGVTVGRCFAVGRNAISTLDARGRRLSVKREAIMTAVNRRRSSEARQIDEDYIPVDESTEDILGSSVDTRTIESARVPNEHGDETTDLPEEVIQAMHDFASAAKRGEVVIPTSEDTDRTFRRLDEIRQETKKIIEDLRLKG